jgi:hypothetical protein
MHRCRLGDPARQHAGLKLEVDGGLDGERWVVTRRIADDEEPARLEVAADLFARVAGGEV